MSTSSLTIAGNAPPAQATSLAATKYPAPPPVGKPQDPPPPPTAWELASDYCYQLGLAADRTYETAAALRQAWYASELQDTGLHRAWRQAVAVAEALGNDYAAADRAAARLLVPGLAR